MKFFKNRRKTSKETTASLRGQIGNMARLYKKNHTLNFIKVSAIVLGVLFAIGHTMYRAHFFNMPLPHIALIQFEGEVTRGSSTADGTRLSEAIEKAMQAPLAHAVLIEANSPGGSPVQAEILHRTLMTMRETTNKPVFFSIGEMCASACLYVSSSADKVFAHRNSLIGSVGVRMDTWGFDKLIKNLQIERRTLSAGKNKALLDPFMPKNPEAVNHLKNAVLAPLYVEFKNALIEGRGNKLATENPDLFTGYIWTGQDAVNLGFADEIKTHYEIREMLRDTYKVSDIQNYTKPSFSMMKLLSSDFWAEVVSKAVTDIHGQQKLELN